MQLPLRSFLPLMLVWTCSFSSLQAAPRSTGSGHAPRKPTTVPRVDQSANRSPISTEPRVILISIDGLRPETYLDPKQFGLELPTLRRMMNEGAYARGVRGIFPSVTYPSHTTILTGVRSGRHGVVANSYFTPDRPGPAEWYWQTKAIRVPTLWHLVKDAGMSVANLSWPVSVGCPCDWNVPEIWDNSSPEQPDTMAILRQHTTPANLIDRIGEATTPWTDANYNINVLERDLLVGDAAAWMFATYKPHLFTIHLIEVDHYSHEEGANGPTALKALEYADQAVGKILAAVESSRMAGNTTIIVTGDHGFADIDRRVHINEWLKEGGFLTTDGNGRITGWQAQAYTTGAAGVIMLRNPADTGLAQQVQGYITRRLSQLSEQERPFRVMQRAELNGLGAFPEAAFGLALNPGWDLSKKVDAGLVSAAKGGTHGYHPNWEAMRTGFIAWGAGVNPSGQADVMEMTAIGPTVAHFFGLRLPAAESPPAPWVFSRP